MEMNKSFCPWSVHEETTTVTANDREGYRSTLNVVFCQCYRCWGRGGGQLPRLLVVETDTYQKGLGEDQGYWESLCPGGLREVNNMPTNVIKI